MRGASRQARAHVGMGARMKTAKYSGTTDFAVLRSLRTLRSSGERDKSSFLILTPPAKDDRNEFASARFARLNRQDRKSTGTNNWRRLEGPMKTTGQKPGLRNPCGNRVFLSISVRLFHRDKKNCFLSR